MDQNDDINLTESQITTNSDKLEVVSLLEDSKKTVE